MTKHFKEPQPPAVFPASFSESALSSEAGLYELAFAFCRECLGWAEASRSSNYIIENRRRPELSHAFGKIHGFQFDPRDFGNVMNAVREWCDIHAVALSVKYNPASPGDPWQVRLASDADARGGELCSTMIRACLDADRAIGRSDTRRRALAANLNRRNPAGTLSAPWGDIRTNAPIALAFCQQCMGWSEARLINDCGYVYISERLADYPVELRVRPFHCNEDHIDQIVDAVTAWCDTRAMGFTLEYFPSGTAVDCWRAWVGPAEQHSALASAALMSACLDVQHSLPASGQPEPHRLTE